MNVEDLPVAVVVLDADRVITSVNDAAASLVAADPKDLIGTPVFEALRPRTLTGLDLLAERWHSSAYLRGTRRFTEQEIVVRRADRTEVEVMLDGGYDRDDRGELKGATLLLRPRHRGSRRPRSGVRIMSAVSHELRSPLTSVRGYTSLLLKRWDIVADEERRIMLQQVDRDARRISRMIGELLDIARLEAGRLQLNRIEINMHDLIAQVISTVRLTYGDIEVAIKIDDALPPVWADPDKVEQVLTNLLENACKYASPTGIALTAVLDDGDAVIAVSDHGEGLAPSDVAQLFQQFFRAHEGKPNGTGLGLWISRGLIEAHGGTLKAESTLGEGSTFKFTLPQRQRERRTTG
jgi:signal transduction histidine kinase